MSNKNNFRGGRLKVFDYLIEHSAFPKDIILIIVNYVDHLIGILTNEWNSKKLCVQSCGSLGIGNNGQYIYVCNKNRVMAVSRHGNIVHDIKEASDNINNLLYLHLSNCTQHILTYSLSTNKYVNKYHEHCVRCCIYNECFYMMSDNQKIKVSTLTGHYVKDIYLKKSCRQFSTLCVTNEEIYLTGDCYSRQVLCYFLDGDYKFTWSFNEVQNNTNSIIQQIKVNNRFKYIFDRCYVYEYDEIGTFVKKFGDKNIKEIGGITFLDGQCYVIDKKTGIIKIFY